MSEFHELFDEPTPEHETLGDALRRELHDLAVRYDPDRADEMIAAATASDARRLARLAAPLATAAAVLAVGAGVAVFATTGGSDSAMPGGGAATTPRPTPTFTSSAGYGAVECIAVASPAPGRAQGRPVATARPASSVAVPPARGRRLPPGVTEVSTMTSTATQRVTCSDIASDLPGPVPAPAFTCAARCPRLRVSVVGRAPAPRPSSVPVATRAGR